MTRVRYFVVLNACPFFRDGYCVDGGSREERADGAANMKFVDPDDICTTEGRILRGLSSCWLWNREAERGVHGRVPVVHDDLSCLC